MKLDNLYVVVSGLVEAFQVPERMEEPSKEFLEFIKGLSFDDFGCDNFCLHLPDNKGILGGPGWWITKNSNGQYCMYPPEVFEITFQQPSVIASDPGDISKLADLASEMGDGGG